MALDADPEVVAVSSQLFWLYWSSADRQHRHMPDFFVRLRAGEAIVVDVRPDDRIEAMDAEAFAVTEQACASVGWRYRRVGELDAVFAANLPWLAGYRHARCRQRDRVIALLKVFTRPQELLACVRAVGDPVAVLPALFHLLWTRELSTDLTSAVLGPRSRLGSAAITAAGTCSAMDCDQVVAMPGCVREVVDCLLKIHWGSV